MRTQKSLVYAIIIFLLVSVVFGQPSMPAPVSGEVIINGVAVDGFMVTVENLNTGEILTYREVPSLITENGKFMFDLSNFVDGVFIRYDRYPGHKLRITACVSSPECIIEYEVVSSAPKHFIIGAEIKPSILCDSCEVCSSVPNCPTCAVCPAPTVCPDIPVCPKDVNNHDEWIIGIIAVLTGLGVGGAGVYFVKKNEAMSKGVGLKIYTKRDGSRSVLHKHPGIVGYHKPETVHRDVGDRHPKGELTPSYEKNSLGVWTYKK